MKERNDDAKERTVGVLQRGRIVSVFAEEEEFHTFTEPRYLIQRRLLAIFSSARSHGVGGQFCLLAPNAAFAACFGGGVWGTVAFTLTVEHVSGKLAQLG
jgi:hypothetical protein